MDIPGDWHMSISILTSIYKVYNHGFLDEFQALLGWNRINQDVRSCYFQAARLVTFVRGELMRFFMHQFVSNQTTVEDEADLDNCQFVGQITIEFMEFLENLRKGDDKWIATCANFLEMSFDFLQIVQAFRIGDAIGIEA